MEQQNINEFRENDRVLFQVNIDGIKLLYKGKIQKFFSDGTVQLDLTRRDWEDARGCIVAVVPLARIQHEY